MTRLLRTAAGLTSLGMAALAGPAFAQAPTHFYCYVPDPPSGTVYMSQTLPVGPVAERSRYGTEFAAYLRARGLVDAAAQGYCLMSWSPTAVAQARASRPNDPCPECGGARTFSTIDWARPGAKAVETAEAAGEASPTAGRSLPPAPKRTNNAEAVRRANEAYVQSVRDALRASDPGVCAVQGDGSVRCSKGGAVTASATPAAKPMPSPAPAASARAEVCLPSAGRSAAPQRCANAKPTPKSTHRPRPIPPMVGANQACAPATINIAVNRVGVAVSPAGTKAVFSRRLTNRTYVFGPGVHSIPTEVYLLLAKGPTVNGQPPQACVSYDQRAPKPAKPKPPKPESPSPPFEKTVQACTTLPRERETVIVIADPRIFVTTSMGAELYMRDQNGNELRLGYGNSRIRPGVYKLGIYGVTDPFNPLKRTLTACVRYVPDF